MVKNYVKFVKNVQNAIITLNVTKKYNIEQIINKIKKYIIQGVKLI